MAHVHYRNIKLNAIFSMNLYQYYAGEMYRLRLTGTGNYAGEYTLDINLYPTELMELINLLGTKLEHATKKVHDCMLKYEYGPTLEEEIKTP